MQITWKVLNETYLDYLRNSYEPRIPFSDYGDDKYKPFFGSLFEIDSENIIYVTQISHPQERHDKLKQNLDFYKIYHPDDGRLIAVVNLNFMFPIHKSLFVDLKYNEIERYRTFKNIEEKSKYIDLLENELEKINQLPIAKNAQKIYKLKYEYPNNNISKRCFDFKMLEEACKIYVVEKQVASAKEEQ